MKGETMRLNPFVYISETDVRFYLLVLIGIIMPSLWALIFGIIIFSEAEITFFLRLLIMIIIFSLIPLLIYWNYKRFPKKIMKKSKLKEFDKKKFPDHHEYVEKLHGEYLSNVKKPTLMYEPLDPSESAFTFGTKNNVNIGISGGLIRKFRKNIDGFKSIFLHEMGHIANRDVEKTYLAASTWRSLFYTLSIPLGIVILYELYLVFGIFFFGILAGYDMDYIISILILGNVGEAMLLFGGTIFYFVIFFAIVYVLRNQMIRLREFYADAKVLEWKESPEGIVKTLEESSGEPYSQFEILKKFHPNSNERIQVLKNNLSLFIPSLWVAFSVGFFYGLIELYLHFFKEILSDSFWVADYKPALNIGFRASISIFIFFILMLAVSSSFHKSILKDIFIDRTGFFSTGTTLNITKFSLVFSLGFLTIYIMEFPRVVSLYEINTLMRELLDIAKAWIFQAIYFSIALIFLLIFASMLIRRSFSKKEAEKNFLIVTVFSSFLYVVNRFVAIETLVSVGIGKIFSWLLIIVFFLIFSVVTYTFIKIKDRRLRCPNCNSKILDLTGLKLNCPNCQHNLYSWAIYSFS